MKLNVSPQVSLEEWAKSLIDIQKIPISQNQHIVLTEHEDSTTGSRNSDTETTKRTSPECSNQQHKFHLEAGPWCCAPETDSEAKLTSPLALWMMGQQISSANTQKFNSEEWLIQWMTEVPFKDISTDWRNEQAGIERSSMENAEPHTWEGITPSSTTGLTPTVLKALQKKTWRCWWSANWAEPVTHLCGTEGWDLSRLH